MSPTENLSADAPLDDMPAIRRTEGMSAVSEAISSIRAADSAVLNLDDEESAAVRRLAAQISHGPADQPERFCEEAALAAGSLPRRVRKQLAWFSRDGSRTGALLIRGLPMEGPPPKTPPDDTHHLGEMTLMARAQAIFNHAIGEMVAFESEAGGRLFRDMVPSREAIDSQTGLGSHAEVEPHTEQAFSPLRPDWVSLACLRGARDATTYTMSARALSGALTGEERRRLREPLWTTGEGNARGPFAILGGCEEDPFVCFDQAHDWGISRDAESLRQRVIELYPQLRNSHTLSPGELFLVDNHRTLHGRSSFAARFDGTDRFVIRSFVTRDLTKSRHRRPGNGRTIATGLS